MKNQIINRLKVLSLLLIKMLMLNSKFIMLFQKFILLVKLLVISKKVFLNDKITCLCHFSQYQIDVKSIFLNEMISELVYVEQPSSFEDLKRPNHVYKLSKTLYGFKQAPHTWYESLQDFIVSKGFKVGKVDTTLFTKKIEDDLFICQIYVDDIIIGSTNQKFCDMMSQNFEMSMIGELSFFLGLQVKQPKDETFICQSKYVNDLLNRFGMDNSKSIKTPMAINDHLDIDERGNLVDLKLYRSIIGSLLYLTASRPDIMFSICMCARFQVSPKECHMMIVKRILRLLWFMISIESRGGRVIERSMITHETQGFLDRFRPPGG
jgi:hypothetical protein